MLVVSMFIYLKKIDLYISIIIINTICPNTSENFVVAISAMVYLPCPYIESVYLISDLRSTMELLISVSHCSIVMKTLF